MPPFAAMEADNKAERGNDGARASARFRFPVFRFPLLFLPLFLLIAFAIYWPAVHGQFVWDDQLLIEKNPLVTGKATLASIWFETDFSLTTVALRLQWLLWGNNPTGYHAVNIALHAFNCFLVWRVLEKLRIRGAILAALLFAVHPVCAASVAWVSETKNTLSLLFFLLSALWFLESRKAAVGSEISAPNSNATTEDSVRDPENQEKEWQPNSSWNGRATAFYGLSLVAFLLALLSKTSTVMLPVVLLLCLWWRDGRKAGDGSESAPAGFSVSTFRNSLLPLVPFFLLALALGCATIWFQSRVMATHDPVQTANFPARFAAAGRAVWFYIGKIFWPLDLSMVYPRWELNPTNTLSYVPVLGLMAVLFACWRLRRHAWARAAFFAMATFTILLLPALGFVSMDYLAISRVSDHFQYLPMIAVLALIAAGISRLPIQISSAVVAAAIMGLSAITVQRAEIIASNESLWRDVLEKTPGSFTAHNNLGCILAAQNKLGRAIEQFHAALAINPKNAPAHCNLGRAYAIQHNFADADVEFQTALRLKPQDADIQQSYASALAQQGRFAEAIEHLREAVKLEPRIELRLRLAALLHQTREPKEAVAEYRAVLARDQDSLEALNNIAWLLATSRDAAVRNGSEAVKFAERACDLTHHKNPLMLGTLAAAYAEAGRFSDAITTASQAATLAEAAGNSQFAAMNRQLLSLYRQGRPCRE